MTSYKEWPSDGGPQTSDSIGQALAGLVARDSDGNPIAGMLAPPTVAPVTGAWKVQVSRFVSVRNVAGAARFSGLSAAEQVDIPNSASIPAGQARIDRIVFDPATGLVRFAGTPGASPVTPGDGGFVRVATVRVVSGDSQVIAGQVVPDFVRSRLAGADSVQGVVSPRAIAAGGVTAVPITFPPNSFTSPPVVLVTGVGNARDATAHADNVTKDGFTLRLGSVGPSRTLGANWRAFGDV